MLEAYLDAKLTVIEIAEKLQKTRQTIYNEIKRGTVKHFRPTYNWSGYLFDLGPKTNYLMVTIHIIGNTNTVRQFHSW